MEHKSKIEKLYRELEVAHEELGESIENDDVELAKAWATNMSEMAIRIMAYLKDQE